MRLICGIVHLDGAPAQADTLARMVDALTTPGLAPHVARRVEGPAALAVLDFSSRRHVSADMWLAADVRLDRPRALAAALGLSERSDEEALVLAALDKWGEDLPDRLDGDFALAAWEPRQRRLTCARDFMGVRPLCYTHKPGQLFAFASLPRGLHASGVAARRLDRVALGRLQFESYPTGVSTGFEEIFWLPAGHSLVVTPDAFRMHRAWRPDPDQVGQRRCSATDAAATLRGLLEDAVRNRLPADGPVAAHLSGGLDSSAIVVMAAREMRARNGGLHTWSLLANPGSGSPPLDEREYVNAVLDQERDIIWSAVHLARIDEHRVIDMDLPGGDQFAEPDDRICSAAAAAGAGLLLCGAGGDEGATYNGTGILPEMLRRGHWQGVFSEVKARARRQGTRIFRIAAGSLLLPMVPDSLIASRQRRQGRSLLCRPAPERAFIPSAATGGGGSGGAFRRGNLEQQPSRPGRDADEQLSGGPRHPLGDHRRSPWDRVQLPAAGPARHRLYPLAADREFRRPGLFPPALSQCDGGYPARIGPLARYQIRAVPRHPRESQGRAAGLVEAGERGAGVRVGCKYVRSG